MVVLVETGCRYLHPFTSEIKEKIVRLSENQERLSGIMEMTMNRQRKGGADLKKGEKGSITHTLSESTKKFITKKAARVAFYDSRNWKHLRLSKLPPGQPCERCKKLLATQVHHLKSPFRDNKTIDWRLGLDYYNLEAVCIPCHVEIHKEERMNRHPFCDYCGKRKENGVCEWCKSEELLRRLTNE